MVSDFFSLTIRANLNIKDDTQPVIQQMYVLWSAISAVNIVILESMLTLFVVKASHPLMGKSSK